MKAILKKITATIIPIIIFGIVIFTALQIFQGSVHIMITLPFNLLFVYLLYRITNSLCKSNKTQTISRCKSFGIYSLVIITSLIIAQLVGSVLCKDQVITNWIFVLSIIIFTSVFPVNRKNREKTKYNNKQKNEISSLTIESSEKSTKFLNWSISTYIVSFIIISAISYQYLRQVQYNSEHEFEIITGIKTDAYIGKETIYDEQIQEYRIAECTNIEASTFRKAKSLDEFYHIDNILYKSKEYYKFYFGIYDLRFEPESKKDSYYVSIIKRITSVNDIKILPLNKDVRIIEWKENFEDNFSIHYRCYFYKHWMYYMMTCGYNLTTIEAADRFDTFKQKFIFSNIKEKYWIDKTIVR